MKVQFEWQAGDDSGRWETIVRTERQRAPWWVWGLVTVLAAATLVGGYICIA